MVENKEKEETKRKTPKEEEKEKWMQGVGLVEVEQRAHPMECGQRREKRKRREERGMEKKTEKRVEAWGEWEAVSFSSCWWCKNLVWLKLPKEKIWNGVKKYGGGSMERRKWWETSLAEQEDKFKHSGNKEEGKAEAMMQRTAQNGEVYIVACFCVVH